jgi:hypothetical protein
MVPIRVFGPGGKYRYFQHAVVDSGADDTVFPGLIATAIGASLLPSTGLQLRWHGTPYPMRFARVELMLSTANSNCRWPAVVAFTSAPLPYPLFGIAGGLQFFDATLRGEDHVLELVPNTSFPGAMNPSL